MAVLALHSSREIAGGTDDDDHHEARRHAARSTLCWLLAQLLEPPVTSVDLEALRAVLEIAEPPPEMTGVWRELLGAVVGHDAAEFSVDVGSSCAADLRFLARLGDRACLALIGGDRQEHAHVVLEHRDFLGVRGGRLEIIAGELQRAERSPYASVGRALGWIVEDARGGSGRRHPSSASRDGVIGGWRARVPGAAAPPRSSAPEE